MQTQPAPATSSFAGLLASLTAPARAEEGRAALWSADELGDDVATLSYERALRAHARYKPADPGDWPEPAAKVSESNDTKEAQQGPAASVGEELPARASAAAQAALDRDLRRASVTVRLSLAECAQLHERAAEAEMTVSAYLRSCTFEVEALRAQVKAALAELHAAKRGENRTATTNRRRSWFGWWKRLFPHNCAACAGQA